MDPLELEVGFGLVPLVDGVNGSLLSRVAMVRKQVASELGLLMPVVRIHDNIDFIRFTPVDLIVDPDDYTVIEFDSVEPNWVHTTPVSYSVTVDASHCTTLSSFLSNGVPCGSPVTASGQLTGFVVRGSRPTK